MRSRCAEFGRADTVTIAAATKLGIDPAGLYGFLGRVPDALQETGRLFVLADPAGHGRRWIEPLRGAFARDDFFSYRDVGDVMLGGRKVVRLKGSGDEWGLALYAAGPAVYTVSALDGKTAARIIAALP